MAKDFVVIKVLDLSGGGGGCSCMREHGPELDIIKKQKFEELKEALANAYPGRVSAEYVDLQQSEEEQRTEAGQQLLNNTYPPPIVVIDGEARFAGSIQIDKIIKETGKILNA
ncbi:conserved hypothetical protein [uncultured Desulfobacterium sp.]|uniref:Thioredoxin-like fold domain-containing protein n=1 Tax=uncultured Desulfobacterium sp. TaxID=201089 RepID=A0A445N3R8_9BACT|nr:conserved hypothetical protein [uncultured Desulfobacterium sp.]